MEAADVRSYPHAGLVLPCLTHNDTDAARPELARKMESCAVVSSSVDLLNASLGDTIDNHSDVFRAGMCSESDLVVFREDVGHKTSFCVSFTFNVKLRGSSRLMLIPKTWKALDPWPSLGVSGGVWTKCHKRWMLVHPDMLAAIEAVSSPACTAWERWDSGCFNTCPACEKMIDFSAEFYATVLATTLCEKVVLYGFDLNTSAEARYATIPALKRGSWRSQSKDA
eukprot:2008887-Amphidinium_carterae.1